MMTSSNGNIFRVTGLFVGNSPVTGEFPAQGPVTWSFDVFFHLHLNKCFSKESWGWWSEKPPCSLWRHCNEYKMCQQMCSVIIKCYVKFVFGVHNEWRTMDIESSISSRFHSKSPLCHIKLICDSIGRQRRQTITRQVYHLHLDINLSWGFKSWVLNLLLVVLNLF